MAKHGFDVFGDRNGLTKVIIESALEDSRGIMVWVINAGEMAVFVHESERTRGVEIDTVGSGKGLKHKNTSKELRYKNML